MHVNSHRESHSRCRFPPRPQQGAPRPHRTVGVQPSQFLTGAVLATADRAPHAGRGRLSAATRSRWNGCKSARSNCKQFGAGHFLLDPAVRLEGEVSNRCNRNARHSASRFRQLPLDSVPTVRAAHSPTSTDGPATHVGNLRASPRSPDPAKLCRTVIAPSARRPSAMRRRLNAVPPISRA